MSRRLTDQERFFRKMPESVVLNSSLKYLEWRGAFVWRNNSGVLRDKTGRPVQFGKVGSADILGIYQGKLVACETKTETGKVTDAQEAFLAAIRERGGIAVVCRPSTYQRVLDEALGVQE